MRRLSSELNSTLAAGQVLFGTISDGTEVLGDPTAAKVIRQLAGKALSSLTNPTGNETEPTVGQRAPVQRLGALLELVGLFPRFTHIGTTVRDNRGQPVPSNAEDTMTFELQPGNPSTQVSFSARQGSDGIEVSVQRPRDVTAETADWPSLMEVGAEVVAGRAGVGDYRATQDLLTSRLTDQRPPQPIKQLSDVA